MRTTLVVLVASACALALVAPCVADSSSDAATVICPPAIYLPAGGKVVTEINLSDSDVLGIVKQSIPALADVVKDMLPLAMGGGDAKSAVVWASVIDVKGLSEAIDGVKNIRMVVAKYPSPIPPERFLDEFNMGVAKAGKFNKIITDFGFMPGAGGFYALPDNAGCMGFAYDPHERTAYAVRVVGGVDIPKLIKWAGEIAKAAVARSGRKTVPEGSNPTPPAVESR